MIRGSCLAVASMLLMLGSQPCLAAEDHVVRADAPRSWAASVDETLGAPPDGRAAQEPSFSLQATTASSIWEAHRPGTLHTDPAPEIEIAWNGVRTPNLSAGDYVAEFQRRRMRGETVVLVVGTVALVALVVVAMKGRAATAGLD